MDWRSNIYPDLLGNDPLRKFVRLAANGCAIWLDAILENPQF
jgi:hypothetical protein